MALQVEEKTHNGKTYRNIKLSHLGIGDTAKVRILWDNPREVNGQWGLSYAYNVHVLEPQDLGEVSFFAKGKTHDQLNQYRQGDIVKITAKEESFEKEENGKKKKVTYKSYDVTPETQVMSEEDLKEVVNSIKTLPVMPDDKTITDTLKNLGFTEEKDHKRVFEALK